MKKITFWLFATLICSITLQAQPLNTEQLEGMKVRNIGPAGMSGRVTSIDVDLSNSDRIFIGTASGGVWKSENGGINWTPIFDDEATQSIGAVAINQKNPSIIWAGTGEGNPRNSQNSGGGIYKSIDGGETWEMVGLEKTKTIHRIIIHRDNPNVVYVGAQGSAWGPNEERGVYRTTDGGKNWEKILYVNDETGIADLVVDPSNPDKLMAAMWEFGRKPWTFNSGGEGSGLYVSFDGGDTWTERTSEDGLPKGTLGRMGLAIAPSMPNIVYAYVEAKENGMYKSMDGGQNWKKVATDKTEIGNRPFYYADIYVDPQNENRVYSLYSLVSKSEDGGKNFEVIMPYWGTKTVHPDYHALWIHPDDPNYMIIGNDGGLNISRDRAESWRFVDNLPLAQFYHINYDMDYPYKVAGGMQDNGSWVGPSQVWKSGGIRNNDWQEVFFGDGFDVVFHPSDSRYVYAMSQGGNVGMVDRETGKMDFIKPINTKDETPLRFHWNAAIAQSPFSDCGLYFGSQFVHKSDDCGKSWTIISPDLTTNDTTKQKQYESGGLTIDDTRAENHTTILAIAPSPVDEDVIWVGTDDGNLQITRDGGKNWTNVNSKLTGMKVGSWIPQIEVSTRNAGEAFVIVNDYRRNDWRPMAYHTADYGQTFTSIIDEEQVSGHALSIVQDPEEENLLFLGTDYGLYISIDKGKNWSQWMNGFPSVSTRDLKIHPREHDLIIGTFGRAAWIMDDIRPLREIAKSGGKVLEQDFALFDAPEAYMAEYRSVDGIRFAADGEFIGDNKGSMAMMTLWVKPEEMKNEKLKMTNEELTSKKENKKMSPKKRGKKIEGEGEREERMDTEEGDEEKTEKKKRPEKVKFQVFDSKGDTIRTFSTKIDTGINRVYWNLRRDGIYFPSRRAPRADADKPSGYEVRPGTYKVVAHFGDMKDSTMVNVHFDPRLDEKAINFAAREQAYEDYYSLVETATKGFQQLQDVSKTIGLVEKALVNAPDSTLKMIKEEGKELKKRIGELEKLYMQPEGMKGIQRTSDNLTSTLYGISSYIGNITQEPTQTVKLLMERARAEVAEVVGQVNEFVQNDFATYQKSVEEVQYSLFEPIEEIEVEK
ncbi:MAG: hypothetical protein AAGI23_18970 [Bacteroidota bacterium]